MTSASSLKSPSPPELAEDGWDVSPRLRRRIMTETPPMLETMTPERPLPTSRGVLTAAEIEMLLRPDLSDMDDPPTEPGKTMGMPEFAPPPPAGNAAQEEAARRISARLSLAMRAHCGLAAAFSVTRVIPANLAEAVSSRGEQGQAIVCCAGMNGDIAAMLVIGAGLAQMMIETACGGPVPNGQPRTLSPIDLALIEGLTRPLAASIGTGLGFAGVETDPEFAASIAGPGVAYEVILSVRAGGADWPARLLVAQPLLVPEPAPADHPGESGRRADALTVLMTARAARVDMPVSKLASLRPGVTLLLGVPADQPVELLSGGLDGEVAAEAQIGRKGNRMALRITRRGPALRALNPAFAG